jgi:hypothetical protein
VSSNRNISPPGDLVLPAGASHPRFGDIFNYWRRKAPADRLPGRQHLDPVEIPQLLRHVALYDVIRGGDRLRFRARLVGTGAAEALGADNTGRFIDDVMPAHAYPDFHAAYSEVVENRRPHFWERPLPYANRDFLAIQRLALPLAADGIAVDVVLACYVPVAHPALRAAKNNISVPG